jgi:RNA polymerase sigma factor (TIGR02999 family)
MIEITRLLWAIEQGDGQAEEDLLRVLYHHLRRLAARKIAEERPGLTLQPSDLVQEVYVRLFRSEPSLHWDSRRHFLNAAAKAMHWILIDIARKKRRVKHGAGKPHVELSEEKARIQPSVEDLLAIKDLLEQLALVDPVAAEVFHDHVFCGMTLKETAEVMEFSESTAIRKWKFARAWVYSRLRPE